MKGGAQRRVGPVEASRLLPLGSPAAGSRLIEVADSEPFFIRRTIDRSHLPPRWPRVPSYKRQVENLRAAADAIAATLRCRDRRPVALAPRTRCRSRPHGARRAGTGQQRRAPRRGVQCRAQAYVFNVFGWLAEAARGWYLSLRSVTGPRPGHACLWTEILNPL
jgi:hypothetical protein